MGNFINDNIINKAVLNDKLPFEENQAIRERLINTINARAINTHISRNSIFMGITDFLTYKYLAVKSGILISLIIITIFVFNNQNLNNINNTHNSYLISDTAQTTIYDTCFVPTDTAFTTN